MYHVMEQSEPDFCPKMELGTNIESDMFCLITENIYFCQALTTCGAFSQPIRPRIIFSQHIC